jgi:hypothetical protein
VTLYPLVMPDLLHSFHRRCKQSHVHAVAGDQSQVFEALRGGEFSLALTYDVRRPEACVSAQSFIMLSNTATAASDIRSQTFGRFDCADAAGPVPTPARLRWRRRRSHPERELAPNLRFIGGS